MSARHGKPGFRGNQFCNGTSSFTKSDDDFILANYRAGKETHKRMDKTGLSTADIAKHLGRKRNTIVTRYHILTGHRAKGQPFYYKDTERVRYDRVEPPASETYNKPSMPKTRMEDLDLSRFDK